MMKNKKIEGYDRYCKICNCPFSYPKRKTLKKDDSSVFSNDELKYSFGWLEKNVFVYPDGKIVHVNRKINTLDKVYNLINSFRTFKEGYWKGLPVHTRCLEISGLNEKGEFKNLVDPVYYNKLFFYDLLEIDIPDELSKNRHKIYKYTDMFEDFDWESFIMKKKNTYLLEDPNISDANYQRIKNVGNFIKNFPITLENYDSNGDHVDFEDIDPESGRIYRFINGNRIKFKRKYVMEEIFESSREKIVKFSKLLGVSPDKYSILRILRDKDLLFGLSSYINELIDHPDFEKYSELSKEELKKKPKKIETKYLDKPKSVLISEILGIEWEL